MRRSRGAGRMRRVVLGAPVTVGLAAAVVAGWAAAAPAGVAAAERWTAPVAGAVVTSFAVGPNPFAAGQHRGVDLAARAGERVRAPCSGTVRFAGRVPRYGGAVTVACGRYAATVLELAAVRVRRGEAIVRGAVLGAARGGAVHLGARRLGRRRGYVDPLRLIDRDPPLGPAPPPGRRRLPRGPTRSPTPAPATRPAPAPARAPRSPRPMPAPARGPAPSPSRAPEPAPAVAPSVPPTAWIGLGLLTVAGIGALRQRRRAAHRRAPVRRGAPRHAA